MLIRKVGLWLIIEIYLQTLKKNQGAISCLFINGELSILGVAQLVQGYLPPQGNLRLFLYLDIIMSRLNHRKIMIKLSVSK